MSNVKDKAVYLSGPMTGKPDWNREAFADACWKCIDAGADDVFDPARDAPEGDDPHTHEWWMLRSVNELTRREPDGSPHYDVLVQLDGWVESDGATLEHVVARDCGIEVRSIGEVVA